MELIKSYWNQKLFIASSVWDRTPSQAEWQTIESNNKKRMCLFTCHNKYYQLIETKERHLNFVSIQRIANIALGLIYTVGSLGLALICYKTVWSLFKGKQTLHILKEINPNQVLRPLKTYELKSLYIAQKKLKNLSTQELHDLAAQVARALKKRCTRFPF